MNKKHWILIGLGALALIILGYIYSPVKIELFNTDQEKDRDALIKELAEIKENEQKHIREAENAIRQSLNDSFNIVSQELMRSREYYRRQYAGLKNQNIDTTFAHLHRWYADFEIPEHQ